MTLWKIACALTGLMFVAGWAQAETAASYIARRDRAIADVQAVAGPHMDAADTAALSRLRDRLRTLLPPWSAPGFAAQAKISLETLTPELGFGLLDGLVYASESRHATVTVTNMDLLRRWLSHNAKDLPGSFPHILETENFYAWAVMSDEMVLSYATLPVSRPRDADFAHAMLIDTAQDYDPDEGPGTQLIVTVVSGGSVFIGQMSVKATVRDIPSYRGPIRHAFAKAEAIRDYDTRSRREGRADRDFRACYAARLKEQSWYPALLRQTQDFADLLHPAAGE